MIVGNGRAGEQLNRKDMVFAAINTLALLDKRTIRKTLRLESVSDVRRTVSELAESFSKYVETGTCGSDGSQEPCDGCSRMIAADELYESEDGAVCLQCWNAIGEASMKIPVTDGV